MNLVLWSAQILLAALFAFAGFTKAFTPLDKLPDGMAGMRALPAALVRFIGFAELPGAAGLVMPWATGIARVLTPVAAAALVAVMLLAARFHWKRGEHGGVVTNFVIGAVAALVAIGRC